MTDLKNLIERPKIDTHFHTGGWNVVQPKQDFKSLSKLLDKYNIIKAITSSTRALNDDLAEGNAETAALCATEHRYYGLVVVNPLAPKESIREINKYLDNPRFVGCKTIQDFYGLTLEDTRYYAILDYLAEISGRVRWPLMCHLGGLAGAARDWPLTFIAAHATHALADGTFDRLLSGHNIFFDIATSTAVKSRCPLENLVKLAPRKSVVFSSDAPLLDPALTLGKLASLGLSDETLEDILLNSAPLAFPRLSNAPNIRQI